jgi:multiple sugar transport system permease protein
MSAGSTAKSPRLTPRFTRVQRERIQKAILHAILVTGAFVFSIPFIWLLTTAFKNDAEMAAFPPVWLPDRLMPPWDFSDMFYHFERALTFIPYWKYMLNSAYITAMNIVGELFACSLVAYGFSRVRFKGRDVLFVMVLSTMMLPGQVTMIPAFLIFKWLGWYNTFKPLYIRAFSGSAFFIFLLRQFMLTLPRDLEDAAKIDGCGHLRIYLQIVLPLVKPALATIAIFTFMGSWNDFVRPLIYITDLDLMPLSLGLQMFKGAHAAEWGPLMAASLIMVLPVIVLFFSAQKYFIQGVTLTGMKG